MRILLSLSLIIGLISCQKDRPEMGNPPSDADAQFSYVVSASNANIIELTASNPNLQCIWDFGNGTKAQGSFASASYPYAGTYTITLTVFNKGGSKSSSQQVVISQDDLSLLNNPIFNMLTGGTSGPGYKTWYVDSLVAGHMGVGPDPVSALGNVPEWWAAGASEKVGCGLYDDRYTFKLNGFKLDMITNGNVYIHNSLSATFPGSYVNLGDYTAPFNNLIDESWTVTEGADTTITLSNNSFLGFYTGVNTYKILSYTDSTLNLQYGHHAGGLNWYLKLKAL
jgi:PKD repeat protein